MAGNEVTSLEHSHPLFFQAADAPGLVLVPIKLTGPENYALWSRAIKLALMGKGKLGFVDGTCVKSSYIGELIAQWEKCDVIVLSWIGSTVPNELMSNIVFAPNARKVWSDFKEKFDRYLWSELDVLVPLPSCDCEESMPSLEHLRNQRLLQFLMGLNESYSNVRSNVLLKRPVVTVNEAYAIVRQEERQRTLGVVDTNRDPLTMLVGKGQVFKPKNKKKPQPGGNRTFANAARTEETGGTCTQPQGHFLTEEQYQQLIRLLNKQGGEECSTNMTGGKYIKDVLHVPDFKFNLLSVAKLTRDLTCTVKFFPDFCVLLGLYSGKVLGIGREFDGLYILREYAQAAGIIVGAVIKEEQTQFRHYRLGHASWNSIQHISSLQDKICVGKSRNSSICPLAKQSRLQFPNSVSKSKNFIARIKTQFDTRIKTLRSDYGTEFFNAKCNELLAENGIIHESSCPYTPQQNGIVERKHRHILDVTRALKFHNGIPLKFWGDCVRTVVYLINRLPTPVLQGRTPYAMLYGKSANLDHLRVFGCQSFACNLPKGDKFTPRAGRAVFAGYFETQKGYRLYDLDTHTIFVSKDAKFQELCEHVFYLNPPPPTTLPYTPSTSQDEEANSTPILTDPEIASDLHAFETIAINEGQNDLSRVEESASQNDMLITSPSSTDIPSPVTTVENTKPHRQIKQPLWLKDYVTTKLPGKHLYPMSNHLSYNQLSAAYQTYLQAFSASVEPTSYKEAATDQDWVLAMQ
ncbi:PREDICTED: uncharacterized protein LOC109211210 [Nicotiana attenuata]|uniref:uncharacterized protein LOC109211210 n=1 Tax=Nicotiana attenuata TaxID=49451 RepID=UPI000904EBB9|nr:PREDICTED: uncharacterized protein LOC109211210 [Nicotiana attenuata]